MRNRAVRLRFAPRSAAFALGVVVLTAGADGRHPALAWAEKQAGRGVGRAFLVAYRQTPGRRADDLGRPGGLRLARARRGAERSLRVRRGTIIPRAYTGRFHARLIEGKLDRGKGSTSAS